MPVPLKAKMLCVNYAPPLPSINTGVYIIVPVEALTRAKVSIGLNDQRHNYHEINTAWAEMQNNAFLVLELYNK